MAATIAERDKVRARHHLGYHGVEQSQTFALGIAMATQTQFIIEGALNRLLPHTLDKFLEHLDRLDMIECEVFGGVDLASITSISSIEVNPRRLKELAEYYRLAQESLANLLAILVNPNDQRTWLQGDCVNVPVYG